MYRKLLSADLKSEIAKTFNGASQKVVFLNTIGACE